MGYIILLFLMLIFIVILLGIPMTIYAVIANKKEQDLRNEAEAHRKILESTYDRIWKEIKQHCGLTEEHRRSFNNIYPNLIDKDIDDDTMLNWILDQNLDFDPTEYAIVIENIADDRQRFVAHQRRMLTIIRQHRALINRWGPLNWVIKNKSYIRYVPIDTNYDRWGKRL